MATSRAVMDCPAPLTCWWASWRLDDRHSVGTEVNPWGQTIFPLVKEHSEPIMHNHVDIFA